MIFTKEEAELVSAYLAGITSTDLDCYGGYPAKVIIVGETIVVADDHNGEKERCLTTYSKEEILEHAHQYFVDFDWHSEIIPADWYLGVFPTDVGAEPSNETHP